MLLAVFSYAQISIVSTDLTSVGGQITQYAETAPRDGPALRPIQLSAFQNTP